MIYECLKCSCLPLDYVAGGCPAFVSFKVPHRVPFNVKCCVCSPVIPTQVVVLNVIATTWDVRWVEKRK